MDIALTVAAALAVLIGLIHSILGERYIIRRLLRRENLPKLFGSDRPTKMILRFAWHLTTVAWFGFAGVLLVIGSDAADPVRSIGQVVAITFGISAVAAAWGSRFLHPAWAIFAAIAALTWIAT